MNSRRDSSLAWDSTIVLTGNKTSLPSEKQGITLRYTSHIEAVVCLISNTKRDCGTGHLSAVAGRNGRTYSGFVVQLTKVLLSDNIRTQLVDDQRHLLLYLLKT